MPTDAYYCKPSAETAAIVSCNWGGGADLVYRHIISNGIEDVSPQVVSKAHEPEWPIENSTPKEGDLNDITPHKL